MATVIRCGWCGDAAEYQCNGCKTLVYCSQECQREAWSEHANECAWIGVNVDTRLDASLASVVDPSLVNRVASFARADDTIGRMLGLERTEIERGRGKVYSFAKFTALFSLVDNDFVRQFVKGRVPSASIELQEIGNDGDAPPQVPLDPGSQTPSARAPPSIGDAGEPIGVVVLFEDFSRDTLNDNAKRDASRIINQELIKILSTRLTIDRLVEIFPEETDRSGFLNPRQSRRLTRAGGFEALGVDAKNAADLGVKMLLGHVITRAELFGRRAGDNSINEPDIDGNNYKKFAEIVLDRMTRGVNSGLLQTRESMMVRSRGPIKTVQRVQKIRFIKKGLFSPDNFLVVRDEQEDQEEERIEIRYRTVLSGFPHEREPILLMIAELPLVQPEEGKIGTIRPTLRRRRRSQ